MAMGGVIKGAGLVCHADGITLFILEDVAGFIHLRRSRRDREAVIVLAVEIGVFGRDVHVCPLSGQAQLQHGVVDRRIRMNNKFHEGGIVIQTADPEPIAGFSRAVILEDQLQAAEVIRGADAGLILVNEGVLASKRYSFMGLMYRL